MVTLTEGLPSQDLKDTESSNSDLNLVFHFRNRPIVIVVPKNTEDVSKSVRFAAKFGLQVTNM